MAEKVTALPVVEAAGFIRWLHNGAPFETCIIGPKNPTSKLWEGRAYGPKAIVAGWFLDADLAAKLACQIEATGVYVTLNPTQEALLSRAASRLKAGVLRTPDANIARIKNLLIDIDPIRPAGVSSSDEEHKAALGISQTIRDDLRKEGWPDPLTGDSGNGAHLIYALDLPNSEENTELIKMVLVGLSERYKAELKKYNLGIDQKVFNAARLTKLYGTITRKGDNTQARPHRLSRIIDLPTRKPIPLELLKKIACVSVHKNQPPRQNQDNGTGYVDVPAYLRHYGREIMLTKTYGTSTLYCLDECIFDSTHKGNEAAIGQKADGGLFYQCFHSSCQGKTWKDAREIISGGDSLASFMVGGGAASFTPSPRGGVHEHIHYKEHSFSIGDVKTKLRNTLTNAGYPPEEINYVLDNLGKSIVPKSLTDEIEEYILSSNDIVITSNVIRDLGLSSRDIKKQANNCLHRMVDKGKLVPCPDRRGCFRVVKDLEEMNWQSANVENIYPVKWPFGLEYLVTTYPGNIIVVAGEKGAGKSAFMYNLIKLNQHHLKVAYFNSEAGPEELKKRLTNFEDMKVKDWKFKAFSRSANFPEVIFPDHLNIIDYFEFNDEAKFYEISGEIRKIHDKLRKGICVIALQKKKGAEFGRGGDFSREKARMYLTMGGGKMTIVDGKIWASDTNPNGREFQYKLVRGTKFIEWE